MLTVHRLYHEAVANESHKEQGEYCLNNWVLGKYQPFIWLILINEKCPGVAVPRPWMVQNIRWREQAEELANWTHTRIFSLNPDNPNQPYIKPGLRFMT